MGFSIRMLQGNCKTTKTMKTAGTVAANLIGEPQVQNRMQFQTAETTTRKSSARWFLSWLLKMCPVCFSPTRPQNCISCDAGPRHTLQLQNSHLESGADDTMFNHFKTRAAFPRKSILAGHVLSWIALLHSKAKTMKLGNDTCSGQ